MSVLLDKCRQIGDIRIPMSIIGLLAIMASGYLIVQGHFESKEKLALAEQQESRLNKAKADFLIQEKLHKHEIDKATAKQMELEKAISNRDREAEAKIKVVIAPDRPAEVVLADISAAMGFSPILENGCFIFSKPQTQQVVAMAIENQQLKGNLKDVSDQLALERIKTQTYSDQITKQGNLIREYDLTVEAYKKAAKSSWKGRAFTAIKIGGAVVGAFYLGRGTK